MIGICLESCGRLEVQSPRFGHKFHSGDRSRRSLTNGCKRLGNAFVRIGRNCQRTRRILYLELDVVEDPDKVHQ